MSRRLRILFVYETVFPDYIGGVEQRNFELASALARRGHQVVLSGFCRPLPGVPPNLTVAPLGPYRSLYNAAGRRSTRVAIGFAAAMRRIDLDGFDVVETANMPYLHLLPLALRCRRAGIPLVVSWYEYWDNYWRRYVGPWRAPAYRAVERVTAELGTAVWASSELTQRRLAARRRGPVELVPCGIRFTEVERAAGSGAGWSAGDAAPLVFAGRLIFHKRLDLLLQALAPIAGRLPQRRLLVVFGDGPERPRLQQLATTLGLGERVLFRGYVEDSAELWAACGQARVAVQPSEREGFGLFPLEAMAAGLPVVYCNSPESALPELVRPGREGVSVAAEPAALSAALAHLLTDDAARQHLAEGARARARDYDWDAIAARVESLLASLPASDR
jgi:glycosyltransferase involved in cell wall biosynthesis